MGGQPGLSQRGVGSLVTVHPVSDHISTQPFFWFFNDFFSESFGRDFLRVGGRRARNDRFGRRSVEIVKVNGGGGDSTKKN